MSSIILECSKSKDENSVNNANWNNTFSNPVQINDGDVVSMKIGFIDNLNPNPENIIVNDPVEITMKYGYYNFVWDMSNTTQLDDMYFNPNNKAQSYLLNDFHKPNYSAFGKHYIAWAWNDTPFNYEIDTSNCYPLQNETSMTIPSGNYAPDEVAKFITDNLSELHLKTELPSGYFRPTRDFLITSNVSLTPHNNPIHFWELKNSQNAPLNQIDNAYVYSSYTTNVMVDANQLAFVDKCEDYFIGAEQVALEFDELRERFKWSYIHSPIYNDAGGKVIMSNAIINLDSDSYIYLQADLFYNQNVQPHGSPELMANVDEKITINIVESLEAGTHLDIVYPDGTTQANTIDAVYADVVQDPPRWLYFTTVTPFLNTVEGTKLSLKLPNSKHTELNYWREATHTSGIYLTDLTSNTSSNFWKQIGFTPSKITAPITSNINPKIEEFRNATTSNFLGISSMMSKTGQLKVNPNKPTIITGNHGTDPLYLSADASSTNAIIGDNYESDSKISTPYYLVECNTIFKPSMYENDDNVNHNTLAIVSKQWSSNRFITGFGGESSMIYQHKGEPVLLSSAHIRILDGDKNEAHTLGENNVIFLQIDRTTTT